MKRSFLIISLVLMLSGCAPHSGEAVFTPLVYEGTCPASPQGHYANPILAGFYPDPSICRSGDDYWMVNSTFGYFPGLPVWHSTDLLHWEQCGSVLENNDTFPLGNQNIILGTFAPQISYNPANGLYYVICTFVGGYGCFFCTCEDPSSGLWSDPVILPDVPGIDPSIFFDTDGKAYITGAAGLTELGEKPLYDGGNGIFIIDFDWRSGCTTGSRRILARYGTHPELEPKALEGPHLYHIGETYFLMCAEGGTELGHSEVIFRADSLEGPFVPCPINPILTQRDLPDPSFRCTGHADLVQSATGDWYAVFLAVQSYEGNYTFNTGRQTCLLPVSWTDGQPLILPAGEKMETFTALTDDLQALSAVNTIKGFDSHNPGPLWSASGLSQFALFIRNPSPFWNIDRRSRLHIQPKPVDITALENPAGVFLRIADTLFSARTTLDFTPRLGGDGTATAAGIVCWQNEGASLRFVKTLDASGQPVMLLEEVAGGIIRRYFTVPLLGRERRGPITLKLETVSAKDYVFSISADGKTFRRIGDPLDGRALKNPDLWGFTGAVCGVYATSALKAPAAVGTPMPRSEAPENLQQAVDEYIHTLSDAGEDLHSIMVLQHGKVIAERHPAPDTAHIMMSVSKTFTATAVGFAIEEGLLSLDSRIVDLFPESVPAQPQANLEKVTVRHLLTMNSGHGTDPTNPVWNDQKNPDRDLIGYFMEHPLEYEPGTCFCYNSLGTYLLSAAVQKVTGQKIVDYLDSRLWQPLGIPKPRWDCSGAGICLGGWGLYLRTEDMAKMGQCLLQGGVFGGRQVIAADWVAQMSAKQVESVMAGLNTYTAKQFEIGADNDWIQGYGYQMWRCYPQGAFRADGAYGQYILVIPDKDAVIVTTADIGNMVWELQLIWQHILPLL
ncbi:MAG: family 43 glycosylhydrolase [Bacteroidales bacterium]|nr:family 43 glycosylhydrolase [Bacteroidales bacterium]